MLLVNIDSDSMYRDIIPKLKYFSSINGFKPTNLSNIKEKQLLLTTHNFKRNDQRVIDHIIVEHR